MLSNAYHMAQRPGVDTVQALGGLHGLMGWHGPTLTDSGGFQIMSLPDFIKVDDMSRPYSTAEIEAWASRDRDRIAVLLWNLTLDQTKADGAPPSCTRSSRPHALMTSTRKPG